MWWSIPVQEVKKSPTKDNPTATPQAIHPWVRLIREAGPAFWSPEIMRELRALLKPLAPPEIKTYLDSR